MKRNIQIELASTGPVGTRAKVTTDRLFRRGLVQVFLCNKVGLIMGGEWIDASTGSQAPYELARELNDAAQAAARLAGCAA